ncbi:hypothetical protein BDB01DRAFT_806739 [Pilobolus umbonatus]|nr:hypothetical protein BDB01DRAFT_806739 [Pilobolus umbonatus]
MERFPFHLFDMIIMLLELDDVFNCLSVNKAWYATFTPYAYEVVITQDIRKIEQFMESMTLYPRCRDAGKYIKTLYLDDAEHSKKRFSEAAEKHLVNVLSNCPNIERLELKHTKATFQAILDPRVPPFPRLRRLNIVLGFDRRYCRHRYLKKCYLKFRSSLECTSLCGLNRNQVKANNIRPFIVLFPHLRELDLTDCTFLTLDKILIDCPSLTSITINGSLSIPDDAQISSHKHPLIKDLCLNCSVALKDIEYITRRFPCLKSLWLESISNRHMDELIEILVEKDYSELQLGLNPTSLLQLYKREQFYKCANIMIFENSNIFDNTNISEHYCHILADPKAGRKTATYRLNETIITFGQRLRDIGQFLNSLQLKFNPLREINLEDIIRSCPVLSVLVLSGCSPIKFNKGTEPHNNLTTLEVRNIRPTDLSFRSIESAFPQIYSSQKMA